MNADQKKRIAHEISNWKNACNCRAVQLTGDRMAALLQGLIDAPEEIVPADLPTWENGDDPLVGGGLISRGVVDFASLGIWSGKPAPDVEPVAYVTGYNNGYPTIAPINSALCMAIGTALYSAPPAPDQSEQHLGMAPGAWRYVIPGRRRTEKFDSSRVGDYNQGWNDCRKITEKALNDLEMRK